MMIPAKTREQVRLRANYACEFCGVTENDTGGELTIDHFQPLAKGGSNDPDNLIYCCHRCNQYKLDYWQSSQNDPCALESPTRTSKRTFPGSGRWNNSSINPKGSVHYQTLAAKPSTACRISPAEKTSGRRNSIAYTLPRDHPIIGAIRHTIIPCD